MARLILKSPYIKSTGGASGYLRYIATRERVELIPDDRPPTRKQEQLIAKLAKDFPDSKTLYEYEDYLTKPTKVNASAFIMLALEANWDSIHESEQYMKYIATRPRAERIGAHGLFGDDDAISLDRAMEELESYSGNVWTHIISLKREDAVRLGFDNAAAWRNLIRAHRNDIAAAMKIPPGDFRWYAAFHDEGEHPHVHMMAWSAKPGQAYLSKEGIRQIKSKLTNDIFRNEMLHLYEQKSESRDELVREARRAMLELVQTMQDSMCDHPDAERLMLELAAQLETVKGKKSYGYLPKRLKKLVDEIVDEMERLPGVSRCYDQWLMLQGKVDSYYHDKPQKRIPLSRQKEFRQIKNAVIQEAERLRLGEITFEEKDMGQYDETEEFRNEEYNRVIGNMELEPLIAIPFFIHDFLCVHPFNDGNGRMSRLLTTLLLYRNGFYVGKYISLEAKIAKNKDLYYDALAQAQTGWHKGAEDAVPFIKYLLGTILAAYKDFEDRVALVETKLPALEMVRRASKNRIGRFNKQDIRELCPTLSDSSIEGALRKLVAAGELKKEGRGKNTCYFRLN